MVKDRGKLGVGVLVLILTMALLSGCGKKEENNVDSGQTTEVMSSEAENKEQDEQKSENNEEEVVVENQGPKEVPIYSINDTSLESEQTYVTVEELTPEAVVLAVVDSFEEHSLEVGIDSVTTQEDTVIVSFQYGKAPLSTVGSTVEETILNSIADSLLDNIDSCKKVIFRAEGDAYESGHYAFGIDEVYAAE